MRRIIASLSVFFLIGIVGCDQHVAGICDCDIPGHSCYSCCAWHHFAPGVQVMPPAPVLAKDAATTNAPKTSTVTTDAPKNNSVENKSDGQ
jgi:hypothetical protein